MFCICCNRHFADGVCSLISSDLIHSNAQVVSGCSDIHQDLNTSTEPATNQLNSSTMTWPWLWGNSFAVASPMPVRSETNENGSFGLVGQLTKNMKVTERACPNRGLHLGDVSNTDGMYGLTCGTQGAQGHGVTWCQPHPQPQALWPLLQALLMQHSCSHLEPL